MLTVSACPKRPDAHLIHDYVIWYRLVTAISPSAQGAGADQGPTSQKRYGELGSEPGPDGQRDPP